MNGPRAGEAERPGTTPGDRCQAAIDELERGLSLPPLRLGQEADRAERLVAELRDELIARLRQEPAGARAERQLRALARVNAALSLIVGVEYPAAGVRRTSLEQARDALEAALADGLG